MPEPVPAARPVRSARWPLAIVLSLPLVAAVVWRMRPERSSEAVPEVPPATVVRLHPRFEIDTSGYGLILDAVQHWPAEATLDEYHQCWDGVGERIIQEIDQAAEVAALSTEDAVASSANRARALLSMGKAKDAYTLLTETRTIVNGASRDVQDRYLASLMFFQGIAALRRGEDENCILCRGESSCILPIRPAAVHQDPTGSRTAIRHFTEYLEAFPDDLEIRWLLNLAHMTLGEHPEGVDPRYLIRLDRFRDSEMDIGRFRDVGHLVGINRLNQAGGALLEDFDNDGLLDFLVTSFDPTQPMGLYRNAGNGRFADISQESGIAQPAGGLACFQTDYNNDGRMDVFVPRGAWLTAPVRPTLFRNDGACRFTDVTSEAGLLAPLNSNAAAWADFDNDGWLDLFVGCERPPNRLYRNLGNGRFEEVGQNAGVARTAHAFTKGCAWIDYDNDDYPDLFLNSLDGRGQLFHNRRDGTFANVSRSLGIDGPESGFSCWAWDYDNDGWLDLFATSYDKAVVDIVKGLIGEPHSRHSNRLFRNRGGNGFEDVTREAGLDMVFATMGSNYGDFDNDGFLDLYLGTGEPNLGMLVPNRMFRNVGGRRFAEITGSAGVGHLQKGHGVACGDWDRDGNVDIFIQMGGVVDGDRYHNILFQNPGHKQAWLTLKLVGVRTNRAAIGTRIKIVTAGRNSMTLHRHVSSGSSFGGNPLEQTIGLGPAGRIARLEIHWPTSGTTQLFEDLAVNQSIEVTESVEEFQVLDQAPVPLPEAETP